jgi:hypothetical protein
MHMKPAIAACLVATGLLAALAACGDGPEFTPAKWSRTPGATEMRAAYPAFARIARIEGKVWMHCAYTLEGTLERCRKRGVSPEGLNFDKAIPRLLASYVVTPQTLDGQSLAGEIDFVIHFVPAPAPPPYAGEPVTDAEVARARQVLARYGPYLDMYGDRGNAHRTVEIDRYQAVAGMLDRAFESEEANRRDALARALVQAMIPETRRTFMSPRGASGGVSPLEMEVVSPELFAVNARIAERIRTEYCAAYPCVITPPGT